MGILWALDEFTLENGCTKVLPGSQHTKLIPDKDFFEKNCHSVPCPKGSLIIFNARVWHRAGKNLTKKWRHSLTLNMCRAYMKQRMDWVRFIPDEISEQLNTQARRIIGFDTRLPKNLEEFFIPDNQRLYKPNQG
jgi:ectoine hydroxylase-related dioxygenase (phytanoyl-CoA dioxygenase family)